MHKRKDYFFVLGMFFICFATAVIVVMCSYIGNRNFRETFYNASSIKVDSQIRVIQLSDLHSSSYGVNNKNLLERIEKLQPDIIICTGDIVDSANMYPFGDVNRFVVVKNFAPQKPQ